MTKNILVVENIVEHQNIIKENLENSLDNTHLIIVGNTKEAEIKLSSIPIDLLILDHGLPDKTGLDWYHEYISLQRDQFIRNIPILFVTVHNKNQDIRKLANNEPNIIMMEKPLRPNDLIAAVKKLLKV